MAKATSKIKGSSTAQVARILGVRKNTLLRWLHEGRLGEPRRVRVNRQWWRVWKKEDIQRAKDLKATMKPGRKPLAFRLEQAFGKGKRRAKVFSTEQLADMLGIHKRTILRWLKSKKIREPRRMRFDGVRYRIWSERDVEAVRKHKEKFYRRGRGRKKKSRR